MARFTLIIEDVPEKEEVRIIKRFEPKPNPNQMTYAQEFGHWVLDALHQNPRLEFPDFKFKRTLKLVKLEPET